MPQSKVLTLRIESELADQLDRLADATERTRSFLIAEAVREYVSLNQWQIEETKRAIAEADQRDFAADADVQRVMKKWKRRAG